MTPLAIQIDLDPNLFKLGPFLITWHGVFSVLGILVAIRVGAYLLRKDGITVEQVYDLAIWMVVAGVIGARILYVIENYHLFTGNWVRMFYITEGGISQWGGIFGGLIGALIWCRRNRVDFVRIVDAAGVANAAGFLVGRIGDVINGEHHGTPTNVPWGVVYVNPNTLGEPGKVVHLEVGYEMLLTAAILAVSMATYDRFKRRVPPGVVGLFWLAVYAAGRSLLSVYRTDPSYYGLKQAQWAGLAMVVVAVIAIPILLSRQRSAERREGEMAAATTDGAVSSAAPAAAPSAASSPAHEAPAAAAGTGKQPPKAGGESGEEPPGAAPRSQTGAGDETAPARE